METALIGLLGVLIGLLINEHFRRRNRIEAYSSRIFDKRIQIYEELFAKVSACSEIISDLIENNKYSKEERHDIVSVAVHALAQYGDEHAIYLNEHIVVQYMTLMMGVEDIYYIENKEERERETQRVWKHLRDTKKMIRAESGLEELDKLFKSITHADHESDVVTVYKYAKMKQEERDKKH